MKVLYPTASRETKHGIGSYLSWWAIILRYLTVTLVTFPLYLVLSLTIECVPLSVMRSHRSERIASHE